MRRNNLQFTAKQRVEIDNGFNGGKMMTEKKDFHPQEFIHKVVSSYEYNSTGDEDLIEDYKFRWICKTKKWFQTHQPRQTIIKDLVINSKEDVAK